MNKKELENEIMKTQEQLKKLQAALDEAEKLEKEVPKELIFEYLDEYYYVDNTGGIYKTVYTHLSPGDADRVHNHRAFLSEEYAEEFAKKTQFIADMLHFKYLYDRDYEPKWSDGNKSKWYVFHNGTEYDCDTKYTYCNPSVVYFSSEGIAKKCADWLNKRIKENA